MEVFPDIREYDILYDTGFAPLPDGRKAQLYSCYDEQTVDTHFKWMSQYGIDGVALQRFNVTVRDAPLTLNKALENTVKAAEKYGRVFYICYDMSAYEAADFVAMTKRDVTDVLERRYRVTQSPSYLHEGGKPVIQLWGIGSTFSHSTSADDVITMTRWLQDRGYYVIGGVPTSWRTPGKGDSLAEYEVAYAALDMVSPWHVSRYIIDGLDSRGIPAAKRFFEVQIKADMDFCKARGQAYQAVIYPGFAWSNWNGGPKNHYPRVNGEYLWAQAVGAKKNEVTALYVGMFDEYDEGTVLMKMAEDSSMVPSDQYFLTTSADGRWLSSDFYLRLTGAISKLFRGEIGITESVPVPCSKGPVHLRTGFEPDMDVPPAFCREDSVTENFVGKVAENRENTHNGSRSVSLQGRATGSALASFQVLADLDIAAKPRTWLRYYVYADNEAGTRTMLDVVATDGSRLSEQPGAEEYIGTCAGASFGDWKKWTRVVVDIGRFMAGKTIRSIHFLYKGEGEADVSAFVDDIMVLEL